MRFKLYIWKMNMKTVSLALALGSTESPVISAGKLKKIENIPLQSW